MMYTKFDKLFKYIIESPDAINFKGKWIGYTDTYAKPVSFLITKDNMVVYGEPPTVITHAHMYDYIDELSDLYQRDPGDFWHSLELEGIYIIDPTSSITNIYKHMSIYGRIFRYKGDTVISFWSDPATIYPHLNAITKLLEQYKCTPERALWDVFDTPPVEEPVTYLKFLELAARKAKDDTLERIKAEIAKHTQAGMKRALGQIIPGKSMMASARALWDLGRGD